MVESKKFLEEHALGLVLLTSSFLGSLVLGCIMFIYYSSPRPEPGLAFINLIGMIVCSYVSLICFMGGCSLAVYLKLHYDHFHKKKVR